MFAPKPQPTSCNHGSAPFACCGRKGDGPGGNPTNDVMEQDDAVTAMACPTCGFQNILEENLRRFLGLRPFFPLPETVVVSVLRSLVIVLISSYDHSAQFKPALTLRHTSNLKWRSMS